MKLLPCPFCGASAAFERNKTEQGKETWGISCSLCTCELGIDDGYGVGDWAAEHLFESEYEAGKAWNTRSPSIQRLST